MTSMFPIALRLRGRRCLVVGEGAEAARRVQDLANAGADVLLSRPSDYTPAELEGVWLCVLTARDAELAARLAGDCDARRIFFCAVDQSSVGSFTHLAIARAGALFVAIGTGGRAPALARRLRELLQALFDGSRLAAWVDELAELRDATPPAERARVLNDAARELKLEGRLVVPERPR